MQRRTSVIPLPPGPRGHFLLGHLLDLGRDPLGFLTRCAREYGDVARLRFLNTPAYLVNHPDSIEEVLVTNNRYFIKNKDLHNKYSQSLLGNGLLTSEGDFWVRQRRLAQPAFHQHRITTYGEVMVTCAERTIATWHDGEIRDIHQEMTHLTLEIVAQTLFGADVTAQASEVSTALQAVTEKFANDNIQNIWKLALAFLPPSVPTPSNLRFRRAVRRLTELISDIIEQRRASGRDRGNLLSMLLHAQEESGSHMTDQQVRDEVMTVFLAGHETTALALSWTWYLLSQHPEVEEALVAELQAVLAGRSPGVADLPRLRYTEWVLRESMRLYPPAWAIGREAVQDCEIGGYPVPKGAQVIVSQWVMHRDPRYFEKPDEFTPDRWENDLATRLPKYAYFPFGGGPRMCIGNTFAMMEAILLLATIAQRFRLTLVQGHPVIPWPSITLRPKEGIRVMLTKR